MTPTSKFFTGRRLATLIGSLIVALCSGTNYVFSAYAPQLGARLHISHTKLNIIGLAGNVGVYSSGPLVGRVVDKKGPRPLLISGFLCLLIGYAGIRHFYNNASESETELNESLIADSTGISTYSFCILVLCSCLSGLGGSCGLASSVNSTAKTFPDQVRATTTGIVISGFGLSAFFFSSVAHLLFPGDASGLLLLLTLGTAIPMLFGIFVVRPIPLQDHPHVHVSDADAASPQPHVRSLSMENGLGEGTLEHPSYTRARRTSLADIPHDGYAHIAGVDSVIGEDVVVYEHHSDSRTNLLSGLRSHAHIREDVVDDSDEQSTFLQDQERGAPRSVELALSPPRRDPMHRRRSSSKRSVKSVHRVIEVMQEIHGKALLLTSDFWTLTVLLSLLSGTGIMYINNVGSITQALVAEGNTDFDHVEAAKWQSMQVSVISIANCLGRFLAGLGADLVKNHARAPRSYCICVIAATFVLSQIVATRVENVENLWYVSALVGLAYGGVFGSFPTIAIEWFGLSHFSENWGYVSVSPVIGSNLFSLAFGYNLDKHASSKTASDFTSRLMNRAGLPSEHQCFDGRACYISSLYLTMGACTLAFLLSLFAAWKDRKRMTIVDGAHAGGPEVIWEEDEV